MQEQSPNKAGLVSQSEESKKPYTPGVFCLIAAVILPMIGRMIGNSMINDGDFYSSMSSRNDAVKVFGTFDILAAVCGLIGVILIVRAVVVNRKTPE